MPAVVDVGHGAGNGARDRYAAEERHHKVGSALGHKLGVGVVLVARDAVDHRGRQQRLDGAQNGDGERRRQNLVDLVHARNVEAAQVDFGVQVREVVAYGGNALHTAMLAQHVGQQRHHDDGHQRARYFLEHLGREDYQQDAQRAQPHGHQVGLVKVVEIDAPLGQEVARQIGQAQAQQVVDLRREDGQGDAAGESHHDGVGDEADDRAEVEQTHQYQYEARKDGGHGQARQAQLGVGHDAVDYDYERARGAAYLHVGAAQQRHYESAYDGCYQTLGRAHSRRYAEGYGQRQRHYADYDAGHKIGCEFLFAIAPERVHELGTKFYFPLHGCRTECI